MKHIYINFVPTLLLLSSIMFIVWALLAGIHHAREMLFVITVLAACLAGKKAISEAYDLGREQSNLR